MIEPEIIAVGFLFYLLRLFFLLPNGDKLLGSSYAVIHPYAVTFNESQELLCDKGFLI